MGNHRWKRQQQQTRGIREASSQAGRRLGRGRSAEGSEDSRRAPAAYRVESHLVDFFRRVALLPGVQSVAQLLGHLLHHVVPQLQVVHFYPRVLVVLSEFGQVEPQALAELVQDPEGAGEAGEGLVGHVCVEGGVGAPLRGLGDRHEAAAGLEWGSCVLGPGKKWE